MFSLLIASDSTLTHNYDSDHIQQGSKCYESVAYVRILLLLTGFSFAVSYLHAAPSYLAEITGYFASCLLAQLTSAILCCMNCM